MTISSGSDSMHHGGCGTDLTVRFSWRRPLMTTRTPETESLLTPAEVAAMFRVDPKTVTRWAKAGKLSSIRTLGGHRRYRESEVRALLAGVLPEQRREAENR
jgi:excisionase family DNA binding protein